MTHAQKGLRILSTILLLYVVGCGSGSDLGPGDSSLSVAARPEGPATAIGANAPLMRQANLAVFRKVNDWGSGFTGEIVITNTTGQIITNWQLSFVMPASVSSVWNANALGTENDVHRFLGKDYNSELQPGETITLGFNAAPGGSSATVSDLSLEWSAEDTAPSPGQEPSPLETPGPSLEMQVDYQVTSDWDSGFGAEFEIANSQSQTIEEWVLTFQLDAEINNLWNATIVSHQGTTYRVAPVDWNQSIPANGSVSFGFNASPGGSAAQATNFQLTTGGGTVSVPDPDPDPDPEPVFEPTNQGFLSTDGAKLVDSEGHTVTLEGVNWFGFETETYAPHGLWARSMDSMLDQMSGLGYTTIRLPFSNEALEASSLPNGIDFSQNSDLQGKSALQIMDILVAKAGERDMKIILDRHRPNARSQSDLWYTAEVSEAQWIADWEMLALRYKDNPTVLGADLHNEPHGRATWGSGQLATDWRLAAQRAGNSILAVNPDWLIIVEGVQSYQGSNYWWGGNLRGAKDHPVNLSVSNKLVYSTHDYATSVHQQSWFSAPNYPQNLASIWDANWGFLLKQNIAPVLVGEFGTTYESNTDQIWLQELVSYMLENGASFTYWSWNPNSSDTGGILKPDWRSEETSKQDALEPLLQR